MTELCNRGLCDEYSRHPHDRFLKERTRINWLIEWYSTNVCLRTCLSDPKYLVMAEDIKPRAGCVEDWRLDIGQKLASFAESLQEKVVVVISGDLSHCHATNCTDMLYLPSPRWVNGGLFLVCLTFCCLVLLWLWQQRHYTAFIPRQPPVSWYQNSQ